MTKDEDYKLFKIQTCVLKVNIHCDGCKQKVKKLLQRTEGVYQVNIDADQQKVTVLGSIDSATLMKKLGKAGKHAEIWSQKPNNQHLKGLYDNNSNKGPNKSSSSAIKGLEALKNHPKFPAFSSEEEDDDYFNDEDDDEEDELSFMKSSQLGLKINPIDQKKGNPNQNLGLKINSVGEMNQKTMTGLKMNYLGDEEGKRGNSEIGRLMNLVGFNGSNPVQSSNGIQAMMMNMQNQQQQPPQLMYHRSPFVPPNTGYYTDQLPNFNGHNSAIMFSDEESGSSCSIM